jgi:oxygen-independent coproporphyrinogen-3 oxidase
MAASLGILVINADIIAGLPEENTQDFMHTVEQVLTLQPQNITVHTLAMKRASKLKAMDKDYQYDLHASLEAMLTHSRATLNDQGYKPYYLYRQKQTAGNFENVGYARGDTQGIYNVRIMEERQSIIALGAGGISKVYFPLENRHERVPNVSDLHHYITRIQEMIKRKESFIARPLLGLITEKRR